MVSFLAPVFTCVTRLARTDVAIDRRIPQGWRVFHLPSGSPILRGAWRRLCSVDLMRAIVSGSHSPTVIRALRNSHENEVFQIKRICTHCRPDRPTKILAATLNHQSRINQSNHCRARWSANVGSSISTPHSVFCSCARRVKFALVISAPSPSTTTHFACMLNRGREASARAS